MKRYLFIILSVLILVCLFTGCATKPDDSEFAEALDADFLGFRSYEDISKYKEEAAKNGYKEDWHDLEGLDCYYVPVYAESNLKFRGGSLSNGHFEVSYLFESEKAGLMVYILRGDGESMMAEILERKKDFLKPWGEEGVYYEDSKYSASGSTYFYFVYDKTWFMMRVYAELMDDIKKNDPEALKGPLFELQKVELK